MKFFVPVLIVSLLLSVSAVSQPSYFNRSYHLGEPFANERAISFIETSNGYLIGGYSDTYIQTYPWALEKIQLYEVDKQGNMLWSKEFSGDSVILSPSSGRIFRVNDSTYEWFIIRCDTLNYISRPAILRFDGHGNILSLKILYNPYFSSLISYFPRQAISTNYGGYLLVCGSNGAVITTLFKFDSLLAMEWKRDVDSAPAYTVINNLFQVDDSSFMLGSIRFDGYNGRSSQLMHLFKNGSTDWITPINAYDDGLCYVIETDDSNLLAVSVFPTQPGYGRYQINKIGKNGQNFWQKVIGNEKFDLRVTGLMRLPDSTILFSGYHGGPDQNLLFRINQNGDSLLCRELKYPDPAVDRCWIADGELTSDKGILFCGEITTPDPQHYNPQHAWLLKTDWYGCETLGCDSTDLYVFSSSPSRSICKGEPTWFAAEGSGSGIRYRWQEKQETEWINLEDGNEYAGALSDTLQIQDSGNFSGDKTYRCQVYNEKWRLYTPEVFLYYSEPPVITSQAVSVFVAPGDSARFAVSANGTETLSYQWYFMGNEMMGAVNNALNINSILLSDTGFYQCKVWNKCGEAFSDTVWLKLQDNGITGIDFRQGITVYPNPVADQLSCVFREGKPFEVKFELYNSFGELILTKVEIPENGISVIDMKPVPAGVYILKIAGRYRQTNIKIVKLH
jgi:hypothetical protein